MSEHESKNMKIAANDLMDAIIEMAGDNGIAITIHPYMGDQSETLGDVECTGNSRLSIKGHRGVAKLVPSRTWVPYQKLQGMCGVFSDCAGLLL